jgi:hypothetical protein
MPRLMKELFNDDAIALAKESILIGQVSELPRHDGGEQVGRMLQVTPWLVRRFTET